MFSLSHYAYRASDVREFEPQAANNINCSMYSLMEQAGKAVFSYLQDHYPSSTHIVLISGSGNNGGDGYVTARMLRQAGYRISMTTIDPEKPLQGDAKRAQQHFIDAGGEISSVNAIELMANQVIVDGLLGTGLSGEVAGTYARVIEAINASGADVVSIDIPSGTHADTGQPLGCSVKATATVTFVGIKTGLITGIGKYHSGNLVFAPLSIGKTFHQMAPVAATRLAFKDFFALPPRPEHAHKGHFGKLLCIGGNRSMAGAIRLASEAAMRTGAGLVKVFCHNDSRLQVSNGRPELMVATDNLLEHLNWADCLVFGPGLGSDGWSLDVFHQLLSYLAHEDKPIVIDADGLNILGQQLHKFRLSEVVITPHPAEAGRLLGIDTAAVERDRYQAALQLTQKYQATCILKGSGSIVQTKQNSYVCCDGNPGMATAGMGDVLAGIVGGLIAQGMSSTESAKMGTCLHAASADLTAQQQGLRGMLASDIFAYLRQLLN